MENREPLGVNEETAHFAYLFQALSPPKSEDQDYFLRKGLELAKSFGHTTASEGRLMAPQHADLVSASERGLRDIDVMAYADYTAKDVLATPWFGRSYKGRYRLAGLRITLDGSPQGRTAWRTIPYLVPPDGQAKGYKGYPAIPDTALVASLVEEGYEKGWRRRRSTRSRSFRRSRKAGPSTRATEGEERVPGRARGGDACSMSSFGASARNCGEGGARSVKILTVR